MITQHTKHVKSYTNH